MSVSLIVAASDNNVIGKNGDIPWHIPEDLAYFKKVTMGKVIVMGRKTWESIGRVLPGRTSVVLSRRDIPLPEGVHHSNSIEDVLEQWAGSEIMIIGGGEIYDIGYPYIDTLYLTRVHGQYEGDAYFNCFEESEWDMISENSENPSYSFQIFSRK